MILIFLTLLSALAVSAVAAYFSIAGLVAIFASAPVPIATMGITLEVAKLVTASWIYRNWEVAPKLLKYYFVIATVILSLITSMGIFGYLSKVHLDQSVPNGETAARISLFDEKIKIERENIDVNRKALKQLDEAVDQVMARSTSETGADRAVSIRRAQQKERSKLLIDNEKSQKLIAGYNEERAPIATELRKVEAEVGPIRYIAAFFYGSTDQDILEKAVTWVIIALIIVFDPLAILLLIAANFSIRERSGTRLIPVKEVELESKPEPPNIQPIAPTHDPIDDGPLEETPIESPFSYPETVTDPEGEKEGWSKELYRKFLNNDKVNIARSRIHSIPKEILDKIFKK